MLCDRPKNYFPSYFPGTTLNNIKVFPLNLGTIQKILLAGCRLFYFHLQIRHVMSHYVNVTSHPHHIMSCDATPQHAMPVMSHHVNVTSHHAMPHHSMPVMSCHITSTSCHAMPCHTTACHASHVMSHTL